MVWYTRLVSKLAAATSSSSSSTLFKNLRIQKHPPLLKPKHSFSNHLGGYKSPPLLIISSKNVLCPNNLYKVKHNDNTYRYYHGTEWRTKILGGSSRTHFVLLLVSLSVLPAVATLVYIAFSETIPYTNRTHFVLLGVLLLVSLSVLPAVATLVYIAFSETIPYTNRTHFVLLDPSDDKFIGEETRSKEKLDLLPEDHPDSVRVKSIGEQIVKALESDLEAMEDENLTVDHLVGLKWEFLVVNDPEESGCLPGGKIYVSSDLLKHLVSDADIATLIGHEVGHIVARHGSGRLNLTVLSNLANEYLGLPIPKMAEHIPHGLKDLGRVLFTYPVRRREEREADYIGLLLMASAGFDPQEAPKVCAMLDQRSPPSSMSDFFQTHPSGKNRAKYLAKAEVMEEAKSIYSKTIATRKMNDIKDC